MDSAPQQHPPNILLGPTPTSSTHNPFSATPTSAPGSSMIYRFASNSVGPANATVPDPKPFNGTIGAPNAGAFDGSSSSLRPCGFNIDQAKKKRGRPRKYAPDNNIALGLTPTPTSTALASSVLVVHGDSGGNDGGTPTLKRQRGRPSGSVKKQLDALGAGGVGFTPHVIMVKAGEDIASKILSFSQQGPRTVCILSANGAICNVTLRHPANAGGTVTFEGRYEIISLSGSFLLSESNGSHSRNGGLSVSLAGPDGRVLGGGVAGMLLAATPVQVIVGSFIAEGKKSKNIAKPEPSSAPTPYMLNFGTAATAASPESQGASSESSDENGGSTLNRGPGLYSNPGQPMHSNSMQMYHHQLWAGQTQQ
ncbi:putative DNA-binding protein ESCAROLA [Tripterygium wilfordii]|uniref:AT-hook motif nuclear-localized protein n=1 Tax=Tripterygium wilfordii TaxID=458696 RepID=A0A7J7CLX2_TRIWF|nr:AT-hook motif nuclear-localized protein 8-like [Tripterygium wilfordii]KAF5735073.1 putative DNA-binding protein ESCAROLA [Tripterygium wilfordii]